MEEMSAFERQIANVVRQSTLPPRSVDAMSIMRAATQSPKWRIPTMSSALKFVAAGVIVALFGGFLLAGILSTPQGDEVAPAAVSATPSPMTTEELLSGMATEEVEPGVFRITNDGVRNLVSVEASDIVAGYDGGLWLLREDRFLRLGSDGSHEWPEGSASYDGRIFEVAPDGTLWIIAARHSIFPGARGGDALRSADGEVWVPQTCPEGCTEITVAPDGEVWASWQDEGWMVGHLGPTGWEETDRPIPPVGDVILQRLYFTDTGDLYALFVAYGPRLARYQDGTWSEVSYLPFDGIVDVGWDGTVWQSRGGTLIGEVSDSADIEEQGSSAGLARFADGEWTVWTPADVPDIALPTRPGDEFGVAPDGSLWVSSWWDGLVHFDGVTAEHFLPGQSISMDIAADGSVWALADNPDGKDLYVITPEAVGRP